MLNILEYYKMMKTTCSVAFGDTFAQWDCCALPQDFTLSSIEVASILIIDKLSVALSTFYENRHISCQTSLMEP